MPTESPDGSPPASFPALPHHPRRGRADSIDMAILSSASTGIRMCRHDFSYSQGPPVWGRGLNAPRGTPSVAQEALTSGQECSRHLSKCPAGQVWCWWCSLCTTALTLLWPRSFIKHMGKCVCVRVSLGSSLRDSHPVVGRDQKCTL